MKKLLIPILCLVLIGCFFASRLNNYEQIETTTEESTTEETTTQKSTAKNKIYLGYYKEKSLNPYLTDSPTNLKLSTLIYDSLFLPNDNYSVQPLIASDYTYDGNKLIVTLNDEIYFSDGSSITPYDISYSFSLAKQSHFYSSRLTSFASCEKGESEVTFILDSDNVYAHNCLTFPIVKQDSPQDMPIGSGRYSIAKKNGKYILTANDNTTRNEEMATQKLYLTEITSENKELYLLQTGDLCYFFDDLTDGEYTKIVANTATVTLNNMVYLAYNSKTEELQDSNVINAIDNALDRYALADTAYSGMAQSTALPFNPQWELLQNIQTPDTQQNTAKADELLKSSGYIYQYKTNAVRSKNMKYIELTMIVNNENEPRVQCARLIKKQLQSVGIGITLKELSFNEYKNALYYGNYDLYLGEVRLSADMNLSEFFTSGGSLSYGIDTQSTVALAYNDFISGNIDITTFIQVFELQKPFIPIFFREAMAYYSRELTYDDTVNEYEPFKNIYSWSIID